MTEELKDAPHEAYRKGAFFLVLGCTFFALGNTIAHTAARSLSPWTIFAIQQLVAALILLPWMLYNRKELWERAAPLKLHIIRAIAGIVSFSFLYWALSLMPIVEANTLAYLTPIFIPFVAKLWLKEAISPRIFIALLVAFTGVLVIMHPSVAPFDMGAIVAIFSSLFSAIAVIAMRALLIDGEPLKRVLAWYFGLTALISPLFILIFPPIYDPLALLAAGAMGFCQLPGQIFLLIAYRYASPAKIAPYNFSQIVAVTLFSAILYSQLPSSLSWVGIFFIIFGGWIAVWKRR